MKRILILVSVFLCISVYAQEIQVLEINSSFIQTEDVNEFEFIDRKFDLSNHERIAVMRGYSLNSGNSTLLSLFNSFWNMSNNLGANAYAIDKVERVSDTIFVQIRVYYLDAAAMEENFNLYPRNMIYVFGDLDVNRNTRRVRLNGERVELAPLQFAEIQNEVGRRARISIGGMAGSRVDFFGREGRMPVYLSFSGFRVGTSNFNQLNLSTGGIFPIDTNFGQFLINTFTKKE